MNGRLDGHRAGSTRARVRSPGPGRGAGVESDPERASMLHARIAIVATIVLGQLWGITVALNAWLSGETRHVWLLIAFQALSFGVALAVWLASRHER